MEIILHDWDQWINAMTEFIQKGVHFTATIGPNGDYLIEFTGGGSI